MKTEAKAKELWCPEVRILSEDINASFNRYTCIGSACMAWRWAYIDKPYTEADGTHGKIRSDKGYCGKYDRPEV